MSAFFRVAILLIFFMAKLLELALTCLDFTILDRRSESGVILSSAYCSVAIRTFRLRIMPVNTLNLPGLEYTRAEVAKQVDVDEKTARSVFDKYVAELEKHFMRENPPLVRYALPLIVFLFFAGGVVLAYVKEWSGMRLRGIGFLCGLKESLCFVQDKTALR